MRHPAAVLNLIQKETAPRGLRLALLGTNPYVRLLFRRIVSSYSTSIEELDVDPSQLRASLLRLRDMTMTQPFAWEQPLIWVTSAEHLLGSMSFPEDFPPLGHNIVCCSDVDSVYVPSSFIPVATDPKGSPLQDLIKWIMQQKGISSEIDVIRFLSSEMKGDLPAIDKILDRMFLKIYPRKVVTLKDLETGETMEWDCEKIIRAMAEGGEQIACSEVNHALQTFHPKGIVTVLSRRVIILTQVAASMVLNGGQPDPNGDVRPWVWRQNQDLLQSIPNAKLLKWSVSLDKAYALLSRGSVSARWTLYNAVLEMCRA